MAWNQPGNSNNNPWGKKPSPGGGDLDQAFKDWQKRIESLFGGGGGRSSTPLLILGIIVIVAWMSTGLYQVKTGELGVVQRFGKHVDTVGDGLGWRLPWPIETVTKVDVQGVATTSYKSRVLTAEPNMVELQVAVQYRIKNAEDYLFKVREPKDTLSEVSESAIREVVGRADQQAILEAGRLKIADDTRDIMQRTLDQYGAGIEVRKVNITDVQVPEAVQQSQRDSVKAKAKEILDAQAYKAQVVQNATGEASRFSQLLAAYEKAPGVTRERLYIETVENVLGRTRKVMIDSKSGSGNMLYLPLDKLIDRGSTETATGTMRPSVSVEPEPISNTDSRQRVDR